MIDFRLNPKVESDGVLFSMLSQVRRPDERRIEVKGQEIETMPYFLTSEYRSLIEQQ